MLPMRFFRNRAFALANVASLLFSFGMFGSIFLLAQFFQTVQGYSPLESGLRILPWTAMPMIVAPIAGAISDRIGGHRLMAAGLALQAIGLAWIAAITTPTTALHQHRAPVHRLRDRHGALLRAGRERRPLVRPPDRAGAGLGREQRDPRARRRARGRGARLDLRALRRLQHAETFVNGMNAAVYVGAAVVAVGAIASFLIPYRARKRAGAERLLPELEAAG